MVSKACVPERQVAPFGSNTVLVLVQPSLCSDGYCLGVRYLVSTSPRETPPAAANDRVANFFGRCVDPRESSIGSTCSKEVGRAMRHICSLRIYQAAVQLG